MQFFLRLQTWKFFQWWILFFKQLIKQPNDINIYWYNSTFIKNEKHWNKKKLKEYGIVRKKERVCFYEEKDFSYNTYLIIQNKRYVSTGELLIHANWAAMPI